jgi:hypothetical protein
MRVSTLSAQHGSQECACASRSWCGGDAPECVHIVARQAHDALECIPVNAVARADLIWEPTCVVELRGCDPLDRVFLVESQSRNLEISQVLSSSREWDLALQARDAPESQDH